MIPNNQAQQQFTNPMGMMMKVDPNLSMFSNDYTLYVGNLNKLISDLDLYKFFIPYGKVLSCRIMKDTYSGESRGFAFVTYSNRSSAEAAKKALNNTKLHGHEMRIMFKTKLNDLNPKANVFIKNINESAKSKELYDLCEDFGKLFSFSLKTDKDGKSLGYAYAQFLDEDAANKAVKELNNKKVHGQELQVEIFQSAQERPRVQTNLYMKNFPLKWTKERIEEFITKELSKNGTITSSDVKQLKTEDNVERYYAYVNYETDAQAKKVIDKYNDKALDDHTDKEEKFYVTYLMPKKFRQEKLKQKFLTEKNLTNLYIRSLKLNVTVEKLREAFLKYGNITSVCVKEGNPNVIQDNINLKFGFINFKNEEDAQEAFLSGKKDADITALIHETKLNSKFLYFAQPKQIRKQYNMVRNNMFNNPNLAFGHKGNKPHMMPPQNIPMVNMPIMGNVNITMVNQPFMSKEDKRAQENELKYDTQWFKNNKETFMGFSDEKKRNLLGGLMFNKVMETGAVQEKEVAKVTGMLIDLEILDYEEIVDMFESRESLNERIVEALEVMNDAD